MRSRLNLEKQLVFTKHTQYSTEESETTAKYRELFIDSSLAWTVLSFPLQENK